MKVDLVESNTDIRRHELLADMAEHAAVHLIEKHGLDEAISVVVGNSLADFLSTHWKGQNVYIVADASFKLSKRDLEIYRRMERGNAHEIDKEMGISYVRVYQVYRRVLAAMRSKVQPDLFKAPDSELSTE